MTKQCYQLEKSMNTLIIDSSCFEIYSRSSTDDYQEFERLIQSMSELESEGEAIINPTREEIQQFRLQQMKKYVEELNKMIGKIQSYYQTNQTLGGYASSGVAEIAFGANIGGFSEEAKAIHNHFTQNIYNKFGTLSILDRLKGRQTPIDPAFDNVQRFFEMLQNLSSKVELKAKQMGDAMDHKAKVSSKVA